MPHTVVNASVNHHEQIFKKYRRKAIFELRVNLPFLKLEGNFGSFFNYVFRIRITPSIWYGTDNSYLYEFKEHYFKKEKNIFAKL
jgi:hypothetical protein